MNTANLSVNGVLNHNKNNYDALSASAQNGQLNKTIDYLSGGITQEVVLTGGVTQTVGDFDRSLQTLYDVTSFNLNISPTLKPVILNDLNEIMKERSKYTLEELKDLNNPVTQKLINTGMKIQLEQVREANDSGGITKPFFSEGRKNLVAAKETIEQAKELANEDQIQQLEKLQEDIQRAIITTADYDSGLAIAGGVAIGASIPLSMSLIGAAPLIISASKTAGVDGLIVVSTIGARYGGEVLKALNQAVNDPNTYVDIIEGNWAGVLSNFIPLDKAVEAGKFIQDTPLIKGSLEKIAEFKFYTRLRNIAESGSIKVDNRKFTDYIFSPKYQGNGKYEVFNKTLNYLIEDSGFLSSLYLTQAKNKIETKNFTLGKKDIYGQRLTINIDIQVKGTSEIKTVVSGWMINPDGSITLNTPFSGWVK